MKKAAKRKTKTDSMEVDESETHNNKNTSDKPEANSPTTSTGQGTIKVPVLFQLHGHQSKRTGSFDTTSSSSPTSMMMAADHTQATLTNTNNNNNNDTNIMWLKPGENWLRLLPRASGEKSILDDTQDTFSMAAARYMPIPQILSARDYGYDMSQLLVQSSVKAEGNDSNNNECVFLVVDVDEPHVRTSSTGSSGDNDNDSSLPKFQLAIKDMRFPVNHPQNDNKSKTEQNASMMPQQDTTPFELCLARRTSPLDEDAQHPQQQVDFNKHKEGSKENEQEEDHFWAGYTALERLPRRQLRILQVGDRLCTRIVTSSSRSSSPTEGEGYHDFGGERNDDQEEEGDFSGVGLVLEYRWEDQLLSCKEEDDEEEQEEEEEDGGKCHPSQPTSSPLMSQEEQLQTQFSTTKDDDDNHLDNDDNDDDSATTVGEDNEGIMTQMQTDDGPPLGQPSDESPVAGNNNEKDNDDDSNNDDKDDDIVLQDGDDNDDTDKKDEAVVVDNLLITQPEESENHDDKGKQTKSNNNDNGNDSDDSDATIGEENDENDGKPPPEVAVMQDADKTADNDNDDSEHKLDGAKGDGKETASKGGDPSKDSTEKGEVNNEDDDDDDATTIGSAQGEPEKESAKETKDDDKAVLAPSAAAIESQATETEEDEQAKQLARSDKKETTDKGNDKKLDSDKTAQVVQKNPNKNSTKDSQQNDGDTDDDTTVNDGDDATQDLAAAAEADDTNVESGAKQSQSSKKEPPKKNVKKETPKRKAAKKGKGKKDENESLEDRLPASVKNGLEGATPVFRLEDDDDEDITEPGESPPRRTMRGSRSTRQGSQEEADVPVSVSVGGAEDGPFLTADTDITSPAREYQTYGSRRRSASGDPQKIGLIIIKEKDDAQKPDASTKEEETKDEKKSTDKGKSDKVDDTSKGQSQPIAGNDSDSKDGVDGQKTTAPRSRQTRAKRNISESAEEEGKEDKKTSSENKSATAVDDKGILDKIKEDEEKLALPKSKAKKSRVSRVKTKRSIEVDEGEEAEFDKIVPMSNSRSSPTGSESSDPAAVGRQKRRKRGELSPKAPQGTPPVDGGGEPAEVDQGTSKPPDASAVPSPGKDGDEGQAEGADETPPAEEETAVDNAGAGNSTAKDSEETFDKDDKKTRPKRGKVSAKTESNSPTENVEATPSRSTTRKRKPVSSTPVVTEGKRTRVSARATRTPRKAEAEEIKASDTEGTDDAGKRTRVSARATRTPRKSKPEEEGIEETDSAVRIMTTGVRPLSKQELSVSESFVDVKTWFCHLDVLNSGILLLF